MDFAALFRKNESKTLEFKRDLSSLDGVLKCMVAFANSAVGTLIIGVEDGTKHVRGVNDALEIEERLVNLIADSIRPRLIPEIEIVPWRRVNVVAVHVYPSNTRPHYLERLGPEAGVFIRVGSTNRKADPVYIQELKNLNRPGSFDEQAIPELNSESIDFRAASELLAPLERSNRKPGATSKSRPSTSGNKFPPLADCCCSAKTASPDFQIPGFRRDALLERLERSWRIRWTSEATFRLRLKKRLRSRRST